MGFYSGWAMDIVSNNNNNNKDSTNQILGRKKYLFIKNQSIITVS
ncbi:MAG: hypothetical protein ACJ70O_06570 [Nitrososphaera sp.]